MKSLMGGLALRTHAIRASVIEIGDLTDSMSAVTAPNGAVERYDIAISIISDPVDQRPIVTMTVAALNVAQRATSWSVLRTTPMLARYYDVLCSWRCGDA